MRVLKNLTALITLALGICSGKVLPLLNPTLAQAPESGSAKTTTTNALTLVDIRADAIKRNNQIRSAEFHGNAYTTLSGGMNLNLSARDIYVTYDPSGDQTTGHDVLSTSSTDKMKITQVEARNSVLVTFTGVKAPSNMQAKGDIAMVDMKNQQLTLSGEVALVKDGNLIRGNKLVVELGTGRVTFVHPTGGLCTHCRPPRITEPVRTGPTGAALDPAPHQSVLTCLRR